MSRHKPLMPKATAVWLVENTSLSFEQIAEFCGLHVLEVKGIADGDVAHGIKGLDPISSGQLTREEIKRAEEDPEHRLALAEGKVDIPEVKTKPGPRYTPVSRRQDRPNAVLWLLRNHPELKDSQIMRLVGTTKPTIAAIRDRTHWNSPNLTPQDPVALGLCSQVDLDAEVKKARPAPGARAGRAAQEAGEGRHPAADRGDDSGPRTAARHRPGRPHAGAAGSQGGGVGGIRGGRRGPEDQDRADRANVALCCETLRGGGLRGGSRRPAAVLSSSISKGAGTRSKPFTAAAASPLRRWQRSGTPGGVPCAKAFVRSFPADLYRRAHFPPVIPDGAMRALARAALPGLDPGSGTSGGRRRTRSRRSRIVSPRIKSGARLPG